MSWEARFSNIVQETERNMTNLQKRLASYTYPVPPCSFDEPVGKYNDMYCAVCPKSTGCYPIGCNPCLIPPSCPPCHPPYSMTDHKQEISVLKRHIKDLEIDNEVQKRQAAAQLYQQNRAEIGSEMVHEKASVPPHPLPCTAAVAVRDLFQQWQIDVNHQIGALHKQIACQKDQMVSISPTAKDFDVIKKEMAELRQFMNVEISVAHEELNLVKAKLDSTRCNIDAIETQMLSEEDRRIQTNTPASFRKDRYVPRAPHNTFSEEMKSTVQTLREQIELLEDHIRNKRYRETEMSKLNNRIASAFSDGPALEQNHQRMYQKQDMPNVDYQYTVSTTSTTIAQRQTSISSAHSPASVRSPASYGYSCATADRSQEVGRSPASVRSPVSVRDATFDTGEFKTPVSYRSPTSGQSIVSDMQSPVSSRSPVPARSPGPGKSPVSFRSPVTDRSAASVSPVSHHSDRSARSPLSINLSSKSPTSVRSHTSVHGQSRSVSPASVQGRASPQSCSSTRSPHYAKSPASVSLVTTPRSASPEEVLNRHYYTHAITTAEYTCTITTTSSRVSLRAPRSMSSTNAPLTVAAAETPHSSPVSSRPVSPVTVSRGHSDEMCIHIEGSISESKSLLVAINVLTLTPHDSVEEMFDKSSSKAIECTPKSVEINIKEVAKLEQKESFCDPVIGDVTMDTTIVMASIQPSSNIPSSTQITAGDSLTSYESELKHMPLEVDFIQRSTPGSVSVLIAVSPGPLSPSDAIQDTSDYDSGIKEIECVPAVVPLKVLVEVHSDSEDSNLGTDIDNLAGNVDIGIEGINLGGKKQIKAVEPSREEMHGQSSQMSSVSDGNATYSVSMGSRVVEYTPTVVENVTKQAEKLNQIETYCEPSQTAYTPAIVNEPRALPRRERRVTIDPATSDSDRKEERGRKKYPRGTDVDCRRGNVDIVSMPSRSTSHQSRHPASAASKSRSHSSESSAPRTKRVASEQRTNVGVDMAFSPHESDSGKDYMIDVVVNSRAGNRDSSTAEVGTSVDTGRRKSGTNVDISDVAPSQAIKDNGSAVDPHSPRAVQDMSMTKGTYLEESAAPEGSDLRSRSPVQSGQSDARISTSAESSYTKVVNNTKLENAKNIQEQMKYSGTCQLDKSKTETRSGSLRQPDVEALVVVPQQRRASSPARTTRQRVAQKRY